MLDFKVAINSISLLLVFAGTYLSLRSLMITKIRLLLADKALNYKKWEDLTKYERIILRQFGIRKDDMNIFFISRGFHGGRQAKLIKKLDDPTEPFRAFVYIVIALVLQLIQGVWLSF